jgi:oligoendopeptidase F
MTAQHVPTRSEIPEPDKWDLTHLFADVGKWQEDFAWLQQTYPKLRSWKGRIGESAQTLADVLEFEKSLELNPRMHEEDEESFRKGRQRCDH